MSQAAVDYYLAEFERSESPAWLRPARRAAIESLQSRGFPTLKHEHWKYTDIRPITRQAFFTGKPEPNGVDKKSIDAIRFQGLACYALIFVNGCFSAVLSNMDGLPAGITLQSMAMAMQHEDDYCKRLSYAVGRQRQARLCGLKYCLYVGWRLHSRAGQHSDG